MSKIKLILFDIGGVLIDYSNVFKTVANEQNIPFKLVDDTFDRYDDEITTGKITPQELYLKCIEDNNLDIDRDYDFLISWLNDYVPIKAICGLLVELSKLYEVGFLSNIYKGMVEAMIKSEKLPKVKYKHKFLSCDIGMRKPDREIFKYVLKESGLKPDEIFFIDDKEENSEVAKSMGFLAYIFDKENLEKSVREIREELFK